MQRLTRHLNCASFVSSTAAFEHRFDFRHHFFILMLSSEEESLIRLNFQETPYRFLIVILYSLLAMVVGLSYSAYASISPQIQQVFICLLIQLYHISITQSNLVTSAYPTISLVLIIPCIYIVAYLPLRINILIIAIVTTLGAWIRCFINKRFLYAALG